MAVSGFAAGAYAATQRLSSSSGVAATPQKTTSFADTLGQVLENVGQAGRNAEQQATAVVFAARLLGYPVVLYDGAFQDWAGANRGPVTK